MVGAVLVLWTKVSSHVIIHGFASNGPKDNQTWFNLIEQPKELTDRSLYFPFHLQTISVVTIFFDLNPGWKTLHPKLEALYTNFKERNLDSAVKLAACRNRAFVCK